MSAPTEWHVIVNANGTALGVYGSALRDMAERTLAKINDRIGLGTTGVQLVTIKMSERPCVGQIIK